MKLARLRLLAGLLLLHSVSLSAQLPAKPALKTILILPISVRFEDIKTEKAYTPDRYQSSELQTEVARAAMARVHALGGAAVLADSIQGFFKAAEPLKGLLPEVFRKAPPTDLLDSLGTLAARFGATGILVFDILGRVGEDGAFNPFGTGWDHTTHLCRLRATMLQPATPHQVWRREAVGRFLPRPSTKKFEQLITELFASLYVP